MDAIQVEFRPAVQRVRELVAGRFAGRLGAAYLGGSIPLGEAWPGASDFDCWIFTAGEVPADDRAWVERTLPELAGRYPVVSGFHLNLHSLASLETEPFWRFILRYNAWRFAGDDAIALLESHGIATPLPTPSWARGRAKFVRQCVEAAWRVECPPSLGKREADPRLWTRKLARNFVAVEGAYLLMVREKFRSFRASEVLADLEQEFPAWTELWATTRKVLADPIAAAVPPEEFMRQARPLLVVMLEQLKDGDNHAGR